MTKEKSEVDQPGEIKYIEDLSSKIGEGKLCSRHIVQINGQRYFFKAPQDSQECLGESSRNFIKNEITILNLLKAEQEKKSFSLPFFQYERPVEVHNILGVLFQEIVEADKVESVANRIKVQDHFKDISDTMKMNDPFIEAKSTIAHAYNNLSLEQVLSIAIQAAEQTKYLHGLRIILNDFSPQNLVFYKDKASVTDFNVALKLQYDICTLFNETEVGGVTGGYYVTPNGILVNSVYHPFDITFEDPNDSTKSLYKVAECNIDTYNITNVLCLMLTGKLMEYWNNLHHNKEKLQQALMDKIESRLREDSYTDLSKKSKALVDVIIKGTLGKDERYESAQKIVNALTEINFNKPSNLNVQPSLPIEIPSIFNTKALDKASIVSDYMRENEACRELLTTIGSGKKEDVEKYGFNPNPMSSSYEPLFSGLNGEISAKIEETQVMIQRRKHKFIQYLKWGAFAVGAALVGLLMYEGIDYLKNKSVDNYNKEVLEQKIESNDILLNKGLSFTNKNDKEIISQNSNDKEDTRSSDSYEDGVSLGQVIPIVAIYEDIKKKNEAYVYDAHRGITEYKKKDVTPKKEQKVQSSLVMKVPFSFKVRGEGNTYNLGQEVSLEFMIYHGEERIKNYDCYSLVESSEGYLFNKSNLTLVGKTSEFRRKPKPGETAKYFTKMVCTVDKENIERGASFYVKAEEEKKDELRKQIVETTVGRTEIPKPTRVYTKMEISDACGRIFKKEEESYRIACTKIGASNSLSYTCDVSFKDPLSKLECMDSNAKEHTIYDCSKDYLSEKNKLECLKSDLIRKRIHACSASFSYDSYKNRCVELNSSLDIIPVCGSEFSYDSEKLKCVSSGADVSHVKACGASLSYDSAKVSCLNIKKNDEIIRQCGKSISYDSEKLKCMKNGQSVALIKMCGEKLSYDTSKVECITSYVDPQVVSACVNKHSYDSDKINCIKSKK